MSIDHRALSDLFIGLVLPVCLGLVATWSIFSYTVDDAYISFRYAQNLVDGYGLVYNVGERVEGYTNFLWTLMLAAGIKLGFAVEPLSKVLGVGFAALTLLFVYHLAQRITPASRWPVIATWLVAGNMVFSGYAAQGLESAMFACLLMAGTLRFVIEEAEGRSVAGSAVVFALAGLTRPEAPMYLGMLMLLGAAGEGRIAAIFSYRNIFRGVIFAALLALHFLWRYSYYGEWLPNTLAAKTGGGDMQVNMGQAYLRNYFHHQGLAPYLVILGIGIALVARDRVLIAVAGVSVAACIYVLLVGGDWMPLFRFMIPIIPYFALLIDATLRRGMGAGKPVFTGAALVATVVMAMHMWSQSKIDHLLLQETELEWNQHAGDTARWFQQRELKHGRDRVAGAIALGDIGEVGFVTNYPILDLLGLVDPVIAELPGGYTRKTGIHFRDYFFAVQPRYAIIIAYGVACTNPSVANATSLYYDDRFASVYGLTARIPAGRQFYWCIFEDRSKQLPE